MTALTPRMATTGKVPVRQYNDQAVMVAKLLTASGHVPGVVYFCALRVIAKRCPGLSFNDFVSGAFLAHTMDEASERGPLS